MSVRGEVLRLTGEVRKTIGLGRAALSILLQAGIAAAAAFALGLPGMILLCLILWPLTAYLRQRLGRTAYVLPCAASLACVMTPDAAVLAFWCWAGVIALALTDAPARETQRPRWQREGLIWGGAAVIGLCAVIVLLNGRYPQGLPVGLAQDMARVIGESPNSAEVLYGFYQMGAVPLPQGMTAVTQGADGLLYMTDEVRLQLLYGFTSRLEEAMLLSIPGFCAYFAVLTALACVMLPVTVRRRQGEKDDTPRFETWRMDRQTGLRIGYLFIGGALPLLIGAPVVVALGRLTSAVASVVYSVLGAVVLRFSAKRAGRNRMLSWIMIMAAAVFVPQLLMFLGLFDQLMDLRKLRKNNETEEDRE